MPDEIKTAKQINDPQCGDAYFKPAKTLKLRPGEESYHQFQVRWRSAFEDRQKLLTCAHECLLKFETVPKELGPLVELVKEIQADDIAKLHCLANIGEALKGK